MTDNEYKEEAAELRQRLMDVAKSYIADADDAGDVVQDVMLRLWDMRGRLHSPMAPMGRVLVRNICVERHIRRKPCETVPLHGNNDMGFYADNDGDNEQTERIDRMMNIVHGLSDKQQTILLMRHVEGMEMEEIAECTGSTEVAVRKALSRARQAVRDRYNERKKQGR